MPAQRSCLKTNAHNHFLLKAIKGQCKYEAGNLDVQTSVSHFDIILISFFSFVIISVGS